MKKVIAILAGTMLAVGGVSTAQADDSISVVPERPTTSRDDSGVNHLVVPDNSAGVSYRATEQAEGATCGQVNVFAYVNPGYRAVGADMYTKLFYSVYYTTVDLGDCPPKVVTKTVTRTKVVRVKVVKRAGKVVKRTRTVSWK